MHLHKALDASSKVSRWLLPREQELLYTLAREVPPGKAIVELGAWLGKSTIMLAAGSMAGSRAPVYAVDFFALSGDAGYDYSIFLDSGSHDYLSMFLRNIRDSGLSSIVTPVKSSTVEAARTWTGPSVGLLFIDANHNYHAVLNDFQAWMGHCSLAARVLFHDYGLTGYPGVSRFVDRLLATRTLTRARVVESILQGELTITQVTHLSRRLAFCPAWFAWSLRRARAEARKLAKHA